MLDDHPIDDDYIDVQRRPADLSRGTNHRRSDGSQSAYQHGDGSDYRYDASHTYDRSSEGTTGPARDVEIDAKSVPERDDRGGTRTGFNTSDAGGHYDRTVRREGRELPYAKWLLVLQQGYRDISLSRASQNADADRQRYIDTFTSIFDMSDFQRERVREIAEDINMSHMAHYPVEVVVVAIISIVANEDDRWIRDEDAFKGLVRDLDSSMEDVKNARILVKEKSDLL